MRGEPRAELETLAVFVHGSLAALHLLGVVYNLRKAKRADFDACAHTLAFLYEVHSTWKHARRLTDG